MGLVEINSEGDGDGEGEGEGETFNESEKQTRLSPRGVPVVTANSMAQLV